VQIMEDAGNHVIRQFGDAVQRTADQFGDSRTAQDAGTVLQKEAHIWNNETFPAMERDAWAPIDAAIPPTAPGTPNNYRLQLQSIAGELKGAPATGKALQPSLGGKLLDAIDKDLPAGKATDWQTLRGVQRLIGDSMGTPEIVNLPWADTEPIPEWQHGSGPRHQQSG